ncbi:MAG: BatA domain-containing protein [Puniceicoccales bacterium]
MLLLSPLYLLGFLAVLAPILIHLIRRRKVTVVPWAAHRFLVAVTRKLQKRKRIEDLLLLLLRCLLLLLLALLFARPFWSGPGQTTAPESGALVVLLDASASMNASDGVRSLFEVARDRAGEALKKVGGGSSAALVLFADQAYPVVSPPTSDRSVPIQELARQSTRPGVSNLTAGLLAALEALEGSRGGRVLLLSDGQAIAWEDGEELARLAQRMKDQSITLEVLNVSSRADFVNLGITDFSTSRSRPISGQPVELQVWVRNGGTASADSVRLVVKNTEGIPVQEAWVPALDPGESSRIDLKMTFPLSGWQGLTAQLPGDYLATDNQRTIGFRVSDRLRVGILEGARGAGSNVDPAYFLSAAAVPVVGAAVGSFPVQVISIGSVGIRTEALRDLDVVLLAGVSSLSDEESDALHDFVESGGGLWINPPSGDSELSRFLADPGLRRFLPEAVSLNIVENPGYPAAGPYNHPITGFWNRRDAGSLVGFEVEQYLHMPSSGDVSVVLPLRNRDPLFATRTMGVGRVFLSALPLDGTWSNLPLSPQFVPIVQRSLAWLSGSMASLQSVSPGQDWVVRVPASEVGKPFYIRTPRSEEIAQLAGRVEFRAGQAIVAVADTRSLGLYEIFLDPSGEPEGLFGVNLVPSESDLEEVTVEEVAALFGEVLQGEVRKGSGSSTSGRLGSLIPEPWVILAFALLILSAGEIFLAQRLSRPS